ncbi:MAG: CBS domain-containing protein [Spirochaetes bacterium]|nr:CBS domain-containing protein [Brevinematales bacterium]MCL1959365.1 CBS domain-containing protein [Spirochaetota bacterium]
MKVSKIMTRNPVITHPELSLTDARSLMDKEKISHIPVLNKNNELVGLITRADLLKAGPSPATSLDMYEISYLLSKLTVEKIMEKKVITVQENEVVEEAARIMADNGIGCLPVLNGSLLTGIITDTDIFHFFINAYGARHKGIRITVNFKEKRGQLAAFAGALAERGGNIVAFVTSEGDDVAHRRATFKITEISRAAVEEAAGIIDGAEIEDIRE